MSCDTVSKRWGFNLSSMFVEMIQVIHKVPSSSEILCHKTKSKQNKDGGYQVKWDLLL